MRQFLIILSILAWGLLSMAQVPYAFRYQASVRNEKNRPITENVVFEIKLYNGTESENEIYREIHTAKPDTNGFVAFSIGEGLSNQDFSKITWAKSNHYIQILLDDEEIAFSQLLSVPYAMHAATASEIYNLQDPVASNDPTTKNYVDQHYNLMLDSINTLNKELQNILSKSKSYADSLAISPKDLEIASTGDTLKIGGKKLVISGMSKVNQEKYSHQVCLGGTYNETVNTALKCRDSSLLLIASTQSGNADVIDFKGEADIWVILLDEQLTPLWSKTLGGTKYESASIVLEETDGFLIGGITESSDHDVPKNNGEFDIWLVKIDKKGEIIWSNTYGGSGTEFINSIKQLDNGHYLIGATTFSNGGDVAWSYGDADMWVFEIDNSHNIIKQKTVGGAKYDALEHINIEDDGYTVYGTTASNDGNINKNNGGLDFVSIRLNSKLEVTSHNCYGTKNNQQLNNILLTENNNILAGQAFDANWSAGEGQALKNIFLSSTGNNKWDIQIGGSNDDLVSSIKAKSDTIFLLAQSASFDGNIKNNKGANDIWLVKISPQGEVLQSKTLGGSYNEIAKVLKPTHDGWLIGGESESNDKDLSYNSGQKDIWIVKLDHRFNIKWQESFGGSYDEELLDIIINDKSLTIIGNTSSNDYRITGLHGKEGLAKDIWILNIPIK